MQIEKLFSSSNPSKTFLILATIFGILFILITPPFQVPDEYVHFYRAFQISEGQLVAEIHQGQIGGFLPKSVLTTTENVSKDIPFNPNNKQDPKLIFSLLKLPINSEKVFIGFPSASLYSPIPYLPQALGIAIGRIFGLSPLMLMYLGRLFNLITWLFIVHLSIKITPIFKWVLFLIVLTPISLFQASSLSADALTNALAILFISFVLQLALNKDKKFIDKKHTIFIFVISSLLSLSKLAYFPLTFLFLIIPIKKLGNKHSYIMAFCLLLLLNIICILGWYFKVKFIELPYPPNVSPSAQLSLILKHPFDLISTIINTLSVFGKDYIYQFVGRLGWLDTPLPISLINSYLITIVVVALLNHQKEFLLSWKQKCIILTIFVSNLSLVMILLYLHWTPVGKTIIEGVQGRYFIPLSPLFFLLLYNRAIKFKFAATGLFISCYSVLVLAITTFVLLERYY